MEESLKARLIGAAVLVALAVLLVPELLSGRKAIEPVAEDEAGSRGTRTVTIELGQGGGHASGSPTPSTPSAPATSTVAPTMAREDREPEPPVQVAQPRSEQATERREPAPAAAAPARAPRTAGSETQTATASAETVPTTAAEPRPAPSAPPTATRSGGWAVQVGAFGSVDTARKVVKDLQGAGYQAYVSPVTREGRTLHRVRVGPEGDRAGAERHVAGLKARGLPATVVRND